MPRYPLKAKPLAGRTEQQGIALFQVLLMVAIMSILLLLTAQYADRSVRHAQALQDGVHKQLSLYSAHNFFEYQLATEFWVGQNSVAERLGVNFYGHPHVMTLPEWDAFSAVDYQLTISIQNHRSLIDLRLIRERDFIAVTEAVGISSLEASQLYTSLMRWQQKWSRGVASAANQSTSRFLDIASLSELQQIPGWSEDIIHRLQPYVTLFGTEEVNPAWTPMEVLPGLVPPSQYDTLMDWRRRHEQEPQRFTIPEGLPGRSQQDLMPRRSIHVELQAAEHRSYRLVEVRPVHRIPIRRIQVGY